MPLHDWSTLTGWEGLYDIWLVELLRYIKPQLPEGYRAHLGSSPAIGIGANEKPDVAVRHWSDSTGKTPEVQQSLLEPDEEVATLTLEPDKTLQIRFHGQLAAALEVISPRNKDRRASRDAHLARYLGYLQAGVNLMIVDVHPRPIGFSFGETLIAELQLPPIALPPPMAIAFRVGEEAPNGGRLLAQWRRPLTIGQTLPILPLPFQPLNRSMWIWNQPTLGLLWMPISPESVCNSLCLSTTLGIA